MINVTRMYFFYPSQETITKKETDFPHTQGARKIGKHNNEKCNLLTDYNLSTGIG